MGTMIAKKSHNAECTGDRRHSIYKHWTVYYKSKGYFEIEETKISHAANKKQWKKTDTALLYYYITPPYANNQKQIFRANHHFICIMISSLKYF